MPAARFKPFPRFAGQSEHQYPLVRRVYSLSVPGRARSDPMVPTAECSKHVSGPNSGRRLERCLARQATRLAVVESARATVDQRTAGPCRFDRRCYRSLLLILSGRIINSATLSSRRRDVRGTPSELGAASQVPTSIARRPAAIGFA